MATVLAFPISFMVAHSWELHVEHPDKLGLSQRLHLLFFNLVWNISSSNWLMHLETASLTLVSLYAGDKSCHTLETRNVLWTFSINSWLGEHLYNPVLKSVLLICAHFDMCHTEGLYNSKFQTLSHSQCNICPFNQPFPYRLPSVMKTEKKPCSPPSPARVQVCLWERSFHSTIITRQYS